jgi:hypothetical protein
VLLADGTDDWWHIEDGTFDLDAYEYIEDTGLVLHGGGQGGICSTGFRFQINGGDWVAGPLTAIVAVRYRQ